MIGIFAQAALATGASIELSILMILLPPVAVEIPIAAGRFSVALSDASDQLPGAGAKPLAFEVASVKPNKSGSRERGLGFQPGGRFFARNVPARSLIATAYGTPQALPLFRIIGGPNWIDSVAFDIEAKAEGNFPETRFEPGFSTSGELMLRTLLAERFKLTVHEETRELPLYWLVLARRDGKLGPQLRPSSGADCVPLPPPGQPPSASDRSLQPCGVARVRGPGRLSGYYATMDQIAKILELPSARVVLNRTGVPGHFSFELEFTPGFPPVAGLPNATGADNRPADIGTSLFTAVQEQLGLRLESQRGPVDVLVIDSIERPTPD